MIAEHIVRVLSIPAQSHGWCATCDWAGPLRRTSQEAGSDAARHADERAREGEGREG